jgi:phenylalanyl-tRNA synthetase beta chain
VSLDGVHAGWIGELHPRWQQKYELPQTVALFELDAALLMDVPLPRPQEPARFPMVVRDIAMLVDQGLPAQALLDAAEGEKPDIVRQVRVFDLYHGQNLPKGRKSLAFRVVMQHTGRNLTDAEADAARDALVALWGRYFGASVRT